MTTTPSSRRTELVLLFDGLCGFCDGTVQYILRHDKVGTMMFAPLQSDYAKEVLERHPRFASIDSLIVVEKQGEYETAYARSAAALKIAEYLGGWHTMLLIARMVPVPVRDLFYTFFAKNRYRWFERKEVCEVPRTEERVRYIGM